VVGIEVGNDDKGALLGGTVGHELG
jgi:hypothetical protein